MARAARGSHPVITDRTCPVCRTDAWRELRKSNWWGLQCVQCARIAKLKSQMALPLPLQLWRRAQQRARASSTSFTITVMDIERVWPKDNVCPALGVEMKRGGMYAPSLDRIDPELGYVPRNIAVISRRANLIKTDADATEVRRVAEWMEKLEALETDE